MSEFLQNIHFLRPFFLFLLLIPLFLLIFKEKAYSQTSSWEEVCDKNLLKYLLIKGSNSARCGIFWVVWFGLLCSAISVAGPSWEKKEMPAVYDKNPILFVLDLSSDMEETDIKPDRLARAKFIISDILKSVPETQSGLIVYSNEPFLISPLSEDYNIIENILPAVDTDIMPANGSRLDRAIDLAVDRLEKAEFSNGNIIVVSSDIGSKTSNSLNSAKAAAKKGYNISVVHISNHANDLLKKIADAGKGMYLNLNKNPEKLADFIRKKHSDKPDISQNKTTVWLDYGYYLLFLPMLCCLYLFRRGIIFVLFLICVPYSSQAGFFKNNDQEGLAEFKKQNYELAAEKFKDTNWQASALYKAGNFSEALKKFSQDNSENGLYNQGNALAKGGKIADAIKKYEQVLEINPDNEDAKFNLEYLKQQQEQQQQQSSSSENNDNQDEDNQQNSQSENGQNFEENQPEDAQKSDEQNNQEDNGSEVQNSQSDDNSSDENNENNSENETSGNEDKENQDKADNQQNNNNNDGDDSETDQDLKNTTPSPLQNNDETTTSSEEALAKAQQYRKIEADPGGLLKAFIHAEYVKNRYKD